MLIPCEILIEDSPVIIYASRNGKPDKVLRLLKPFLEKFSEERKTSGEFTDTPECLAAQVIVRFGFEICEDDFSNLKVGTRHFPEVAYLYHIDQQLTITIWQPTADYHRDPSLGLTACKPAEYD
ncbi:histidine kinase [Nodosilinea sp. P-1105]|uniref:histidine kinase n=1 Tax=Nodosilinea sp. P-1105 TaxID=2546229 RepID=UPI00146CB0BD|nr:histidine kinase [Nodosilinea sp. P-1105]NMF86359.1 histidine kinase [Nodosilinea sp. P-1105]